MKLQRSIKAPAFLGLDLLIKRTVVRDGSLPSSLISRSAVSKFQRFVYQNQDRSSAKYVLITSQNLVALLPCTHPGLFWIYRLIKMEFNFKQKGEGQSFRKWVELYSAVLTKKNQTLISLGF